MQKTLTKILVFALALILLGAFGIQTTPKAPEVDVSQTAMINTMVAAYFETQTASVPLATPTLVPSQTPIPTVTIVSSVVTFPPPPSLNIASPTFVLAPLSPLATAVPNLPAAGSGSGSASGCYNLAYIRDTSIPDGTKINSRETFKKSWRVQNTGTCPWMYPFRLVLLSCEDFDAGQTTVLRKQIEPGGSTEITLELTAPKKSGKYTSYWQMSDGTNLFGDTLGVSIIVP